MKSITFTNVLLAVSLLTTSVSGWSYNHKAVKIIQHCTTQYCNQNVHPPQSYTKTIHKTTKSIVTITPKPSTCYITKKDQTKTVTKKHTKTYTVTSKCSTRTVYKPFIVTATRTISKTKTLTISIVTTITPDSTVVPIPPGFVSAGDDPDNQYTLSGEDDGLEKRHKETFYPTSVKCTKTIQTIYKHTVTAKRPTTTITKPGKTKTKTIKQIKKVTKTIYQQKNPKTTTITHIISTRTTTKTKTSTKTVTKRVTSFAPRITTYGACGPHNHFQGPSGSVDVVVLPDDLIVPARIAYDCCAQCHEHVNAQGVHDCAGSYFRYETAKLTAVCRLRLTNVCSYNNHLRFTPSKDALKEVGQVGNGPCGRWKVQL
ncbi:hypothetical protein TWF788_007518 [Orbilia oligospora]|uniref:Apple domain-containing protein n=1 Tax=Orbilia oligospora TaxID=2813651 RepID=A0A7C8TWQ8_ORBOL|nr:hypothetical protein TWF788_007518 [Orbilia oligospora]